MNTGARVRADGMMMEKLILASASPRRAELLRRLVSEFEVYPSQVAEPSCRPAGVEPRAWAESLAYFKALSVAGRRPGRWVLGADTLVACGGSLLGKPRDLDDARRMLLLQAGRSTDVITGVCLHCRARRGVVRSAVTRVWMRDDRTEIERYLGSGDWHGKAGAYGIQDVGDRLIERTDGSFSNVVGLPLEVLAGVFSELGLAWPGERG